MARFTRTMARTGLRIPASGARTQTDDIATLLQLTHSDDPADRQLALRNLCTCHVQRDEDEVWRRLFELFDDEDHRVRREALHSLTDSTPASRIADVVAALERRYNDPEPRLRRRIRATVMHYRRTGKITDAPR